MVLLGGGMQRPGRVIKMRTPESAEVCPACEQDAVDIVVTADQPDSDCLDAHLIADPIGKRCLVAAAEGWPL